LRDADEIVNGIKQNGIADGNFMAIPCFFFFFFKKLYFLHLPVHYRHWTIYPCLAKESTKKAPTAHQ